MTETHVRYVVEIKHVKKVESAEIKQVCIKETPTDKVEYDSGTRKTFAMAKEHQVVDVPKVEIVERSIYRQECIGLQVSDVIKAVLEASRDTIKAQ
jgi:hypothetical protein